MRRMCRLFFLLAVLCAVRAAETAGNKVKTDDSARGTDFSEVCASISSKKYVRGTFVQTKFIRNINRSIQSSGEFVISAADGILWDTKKPFPSVLVMTKTAVVQIGASGSRSVLAAGSNPTFEEFAAVLSSVFNGDAGQLERSFDIDFAGSVSGWSMVLVPKDDSVRTFVSSIEMAGAESIDQILLTEPSSGFVRYDFSDRTYPEMLSAREAQLFAGK